MKRLTMISLALVAPVAATPAMLSGQTAPVPAPTGVSVRDGGLVATWYPPASGKRGPALLVLGGSEGGEAGGKRLAEAFARQGYGVLALAYFKAEGLPGQLQEIPLEYFGKAIAWMQAQPLIDAGRIGIYGISKGGEAALLVASREPAIKAVVAVVPSSMVWQGINTANYADVKSSFSLGGQPVAYLPYDTSAAFSSVLDLYQRSLKFAGAHPGAAIPVEKIAGPVLLLSAKGDMLWPSSEMSDQVIRRLDAKGFKFRHEHIAYPNAGHGAITPPGGPGNDTGYANMGGDEAGNAFARSNSWAAIAAFFKTTIGAAK
ncbi:MAG: dienelactone hydrolase [Sphingomonadales bacterium]|nr:MAG: dienelactone hydrolase [Sphingomonadales bacterium]